MGLCQNVYRRGALYWWRRRFVDPAVGRSRTIAISLRVREPRVARRLCATLNARACEIASRVESGMKTVDDAKNDLVAVVDGVSWRLSDGALAVLGMLDASAPPPTVGITRDQQIAVVSAMAAEAEAEITEGATANRLRATFDGQGQLCILQTQST